MLAAYALVRSGRARPEDITDAATRDFLADMRLPAELPPQIDAFFDELVHDSHATFYMVGPTTKLDREQLVKAVRKKAASGQALNGLEERIVAEGGVPVLSDADVPDLLAAIAAYKRLVLKAAGQTTRREVDGHIHYRRVFDGS